MDTSLINVYRQAEDYFFNGISLKSLQLGDEANAYLTGIPIADLNLIYITKNPNDLENILRQGDYFFSQDNFSFVVIIPQPFCNPQTENIFNTMGYHQTGQTAAMGSRLEDFNIISTAPSTEIIIRANDHELNDWSIPLIGAFESTSEISSMYAAIHKNGLKKNINLHHFSLYKDEKPIASITLSIHDKVSRIDDVGTLPQFQAKGYATLLMRYVLQEAKKLGAHYCFLEASDSGLGVYQNLGFEILFKNNIYSKTA